MKEGEPMEFPSWFRQAIQKRLDDISAHIEHHPDLNRIGDKERKAFERLFACLDIGRMPEFADWEDHQYLKQALMNERLYLQRLKDGMQLATSLADHPHAFEGLGSVNTNHRKPAVHRKDSGG
ncbi:hypothetical protein MHB77_23720 [Paenibacillus sp. FSL K6-3166]|uniref:hypothetical protein n=1 Tax=unclassified Paenibacillus TaxID=185978 RepID=UPI00117F520C|nr:hypothetical protein [Paenibacillus sp. VTT E-133291]